MPRTQETLARSFALFREPTRTSPDWIGALEAVDPLRLAFGIALCIAVLGALGAVRIRAHSFAAFDLDREYTVPATFSALLDISAAIGAEALRRRTGKKVLAGLVVLFAFMGVDEFASIHEHLERWTGIDWMKLYIPVFIYAGIAWIAVLREVRTRQFWLCLWGGAGCWAFAQFMEVLEWSGTQRTAHYNTEMFTEELLEMAGSALFLLGMLVALRVWRERRATAG